MLSFAVNVAGRVVVLVTLSITFQTSRSVTSICHGLGYVWQESSVFRGLSVHDNIRLILQETGVPRAQHAQRVQKLLEKFALKAVENTVGRALSRAELARALASNCAAGGGPPKILLVDKPFAGVAEMQRQLRRLCDEEGMGIILITDDHNVNDVTLRICDRAYMVPCNGCVMASGGPEELKQDLYVKKYFQRW